MQLPPQPETSPPLEQAPEHIKLAVDIIQSLEQSNIKNQVAIAALKIVLTDLEHKSVNN